MGADIHISSYAPHSLVFPRARAVVHHGGIGTTGQALRAGRPQLVTPFLGDQFDNAERLQRLGVARVLDGKTATAQALYEELAAFDESYEARAVAVAEEVRREEGAGMAALRIAALVAQRALAQEEAMV